MNNLLKQSRNLIDYAYNVYSQNGEDGIIQEIIKRLDIEDSSKKWAVEFGAWDGMHLSNTFNLVKQEWNAIYIEGEKSRFNELLKTSKKYPQIFAINAFVARDSKSKDSLDNLLKTTALPIDFDLLSIDIDSYDLEVWESLKEYLPKIVIIEINSNYPPGIIKWHSSKHKNTNGNSFSATLIVAKNKGYELCCHSGNMIFIKRELLGSIKLEDKYVRYPELLYQDLKFYLGQKPPF